MTAFPYRLTEATAPRLGLIVLQVDETIEQDFRKLFAPGSAQLHVTRVPSGEVLTPETIARMGTQLTASAALLPPAVEFDVVGYACTSATASIGADRVRELVQDGAATNAVTNPMSAALAATETLRIRRIGIVSPYIASVGKSLADAFQAHGLAVDETLSFAEEIEARVARIDPASTAEAARVLTQRNDLDGLFLSCTNLRTLDIIDDLEAELDLPVLSSNQVLAWHMARLSGATCANGPGRLLRV